PYKLTILLILLILTGCVNSKDLLTDQQMGIIPEGAERIVYTYDGYKADLYDTIYTALQRDGFRISAENEERSSITTEGKGVGQSTLLRMQVFVEETEEGTTIANFRPEYKPGDEAEI